MDYPLVAYSRKAVGLRCLVRVTPIPWDALAVCSNPLPGISIEWKLRLLTRRWGPGGWQKRRDSVP